MFDLHHKLLMNGAESYVTEYGDLTWFQFDNVRSFKTAMEHIIEYINNRGGITLNDLIIDFDLYLHSNVYPLHRFPFFSLLDILL